MKLNIPKVLFSNGKKKQHRLRHFQLRCWFYKFPGEAFPSFQEKPFYSSCQFSYKALKSSWKQRPRQIPCFGHSFQSSSNGHSHTHTHPLTKLDRFPVPPKTIKRTSSILRQFCFVSLIPQVVSLCLCRLFHKSYRCVCVVYSTSRIADLFKSADKQVKAF